MIEGFIDSASLYNITFALARSKPDQSFPMEWELALDVTSALISSDNLTIPPSPKREMRSASGTYGVLVSGLNDALRFPKTAPEILSKQIITGTKKWSRSNKAKLNETLQRFALNSDNKQDLSHRRWLETLIDYEWEEHIRRRGSLVDIDFISQIAHVLDMPNTEITRAYEISSDAEYVKQLQSKSLGTDEFELIKDSFIISTLLRGRFYDVFAKKSEQQILSHPIRQGRITINHASVPIDVSNFERYLSTIVLASAFSETDTDRRAKLWVENVLKLRKARRSIRFDGRLTEERARDDAVHEAKRFDVRAHSRSLETAIDATINLFGTAVGCFLDPLFGAIVGVGLYAGLEAFPVGKHSASAVSRLRLNTLSMAKPGRIGRPEGIK